jgi:hypothetical protein
VNAVHDLQRKRALIRSLLVPTDPADAMTAYYALHHPAPRVTLALHQTPTGGVDGFLAVCQTGRDLFVPLVVLRASPESVVPLIRRALHPGRPYTVIAPPSLRRALEDVLELRASHRNAIYSLAPSAFRPVLNVMVQTGRGAYRYEIRVEGRVVAAAGVNWRTDTLAGIYAYTRGDYGGRGWARAVGASCVQELLAEGLLPLYTVAEDDVDAQTLAGSLGFRDSGAREYECDAVLRASGKR